MVVGTVIVVVVEVVVVEVDVLVVDVVVLVEVVVASGVCINGFHVCQRKIKIVAIHVLNAIKWILNVPEQVTTPCHHV